MTFLKHPRAVALLKRFESQIAFVQARLSPQAYLGLHLTLGALVLIGASWLFGGIAEDVLSGDPLTVVDDQVANWFHAHSTPVLTRLMLLITHLHSTAGISAFVLLFALFLMAKRDWYWLMSLVIIVPSGMLLNMAMKYAFHRVRPHFDDAILTLTTYSFPSGHAASVTLFYGVLAAYMVRQVGEWRRRVLIVLGAFLIIVLVALSRIYLGVHYLSDVLAAFAEAVAWLALWLTAIQTVWRRRVRR